MEEWLRVAQSLPVGHSTRIRHGHELRDNLVVHNRPDRWSAWCFRCNRGWTERKTHVKQLEIKVEHKDWKKLPEDLQHPPEHIMADRLWRYGITEHPALQICGYWPRYSPSAQRLYLIRGDQWEGRTVSNESTAPKWVHSHPYSEFRVHGPSGCRPPKPFIIITEDVLSAVKFAHALHGHREALIVSTHGTGLHREALRLLVQYDTVYFAYDGDEPGDQAFRTARKKLSPFGITMAKLAIPEGHDPKDLTIETLRSLIQE